jgi:hypothetical protein
VTLWVLAWCVVATAVVCVVWRLLEEAVCVDLLLSKDMGGCEGFVLKPQ